MSNLSFADFAATLQAAQTAIDNAPKLEQERDNALNAMIAAQEHAQRLEERINGPTGYKVFISQLEGRLREAEVARDTFRHASELVASQRDRLVSAFETAASMVADEVRQIVPQPEPTPEPDYNVSTVSTGYPVPSVPPQDQSAAGPTPEPIASASEPTALLPDPGPAIGDAMSQPYAGKLYQNVPGWIDRKDWLAGGGTEYGYDFRGHDSDAISSLLYQPVEVLSDGKPESQSIGYGSDRKTYV